MAKEPENQKNTSLEELEELTQQDRISQIQFSEPELHSFNASDIFELKEEEKPKRGLFGKRSRKKATVRIRRQIFDDGQEITEEAATVQEEPEPTVFSSSEDVAPAVDELLQTQLPQEEAPQPDDAADQQPESGDNAPTIEMDAVTEETLKDHEEDGEPAEENGPEADAGETVMEIMTEESVPAADQEDEPEAEDEEYDSD